MDVQPVFNENPLQVPTEFLKIEWVSGFWEKVEFSHNHAAEKFALDLAVKQGWKCSIKPTIAIPEQKWFFMNQLSWKNRFKIEVRDALAEIEVSYNKDKLRESLLKYHFAGDELDQALALIP